MPPDSPLPHLPPLYVTTDPQAFQTFAAVLEAVRPQVDAEIQRAALGIPVFAAIMATLDPAQMAAEGVKSQELERLALVEGQWQAYLEGIVPQGALYAQMGIAFSDWYRLLEPYRRIIQDAVLPTDMPATRQTLTGMNAFLDIAMSTIAKAYIEAREVQIRHAESDLQLYRDMFHNANAGKAIFHWETPPDPKTLRLVAANARSMRTWGGVVEIGRSFAELWPERLESPALAHYAAAATAGETRTWSAETEWEGKPAHFDVRSFPLNDGHIGVMFNDVTVQKVLDNEVQRRMRELARSNQDLDDFAYVASHDLKSPLRDIDNLAKWITEDMGEALPAGTAKHLLVMKDRIARMEQLLDDLLAYSRIGRATLTVETFEVSGAIDNVLRFLDPSPGFHIDVHASGCRTQTPRVSLEQVIRNLVSNAMKHHSGSAGHIGITVTDAGEWLDIAVSDDGPGIPPEYHERVFRMFQTLRPRYEGSGSGIGLAIVKKLVESHGGYVQIRSGAGPGTTIGFTWPKRWKEDV